MSVTCSCERARISQRERAHYITGHYINECERPPSALAAVHPQSIHYASFTSPSCPQGTLPRTVLVNHQLPSAETWIHLGSRTQPTHHHARHVHERRQLLCLLHDSITMAKGPDPSSEGTVMPCAGASAEVSESRELRTPRASLTIGVSGGLILLACPSARYSALVTPFCQAAFRVLATSRTASLLHNGRSYDNVHH